MSITTWEASLALPISPSRDHIHGPVDAPVMLLEYGDYECPYCGAAHPIVKGIQQSMGNALGFVFRHFPLTTVHPHSERAAEAAEAAGAQGKFWAMHDMLYEHQRHLADPHLVSYAQALGLDLELFRDALIQHVYAPRVREDFISGVRSGVNGTPTFYINGLRYDGSWDFATLLTAVRQTAGEVSA